MVISLQVGDEPFPDRMDPSGWLVVHAELKMLPATSPKAS